MSESSIIPDAEAKLDALNVGIRQPRTVAGRHTIAAFPSADPTYVLAILAIEAEARAAALDAVAEALGDCEVGWGESLTTDLRQSEVRAAIDALREGADKP